MDAHQERMEVSLNAWQNKMKVRREVTEAYPERTEARTETDKELVEAKIKTGLVEVETMDLEANPE
jgi:hypothetical protein